MYSFIFATAVYCLAAHFITKWFVSLHMEANTMRWVVVQVLSTLISMGATSFIPDEKSPFDYGQNSEENMKIIENRVLPMLDGAPRSYNEDDKKTIEWIKLSSNF